MTSMTPAEPLTADQLDDHPEATCERCHRPNVWAWHAPSPLWNRVMRDPATGNDEWSIVCPPCFAELAEAVGHWVWHFEPDGVDVTPLWEDKDGRVWSSEECLWIDPLLAAARATTGADREDEVLQSAYRMALGQIEADGQVINRLKRALEVAAHQPHDQLGEPDPDSGFPVCSVCGAIQTGADTHEPGEFHRYGPLVCEVCGLRGQINVSVEPQRETEQTDG